MGIFSISFVVLLVAVYCTDAGRIKRSDWRVGGSYSKTGGRDKWSANVGYKNGGFSTDVGYKGTKGYHHVGGEVGYKKDNFHVKGNGFRDTAGNWGVGGSIGWSFKRSLGAAESVYVLKVEADPCQFIVYDRDQDGSITNEELREVFAEDEELADDLFGSLDVDKNGEVTFEEFEVKKVEKIVPCALPVDDEE